MSSDNATYKPEVKIIGAGAGSAGTSPPGFKSRPEVPGLVPVPLVVDWGSIFALSPAGCVRL